MKTLLISLLIIPMLIFILITGCTKQPELTAEQAKAIAEESYIFAYPMLDNYKTMYVVADMEGLTCL